MLKRSVFYCFTLLLISVFFPTDCIFASENRSTEELVIPPADPLFEKQWSLENKGTEQGFLQNIDIDIKDVWNRISGKKEVIVAVIDTGVDIAHEDLQNIFWINKREIPNNGLDDDNNGYIDDIHGWNFYNNNNKIYMNQYDKHSTHITGIIAANSNDIGITGIASKAKVKIMVLKVLGGKEETGYTHAIGNAIRYAENNGASICNLSFGTYKNDRHLMDSIKNSKMLFITAAGNGEGGRGFNLSERPVFPASLRYNNMITVANLKPNGYLNPSSNYGRTDVHLAAPGTKILSTLDWSTFRNGVYEEPYTFMSGTSMAVPMVTGVAALLFSSYPELSLEEVKEGILKGVKKLSNLKNQVNTGGILSAKGAFDYCDSIILPRKKQLEEQEKKRKQDEAAGLRKGKAPHILIRKNQRGKFSVIFKDEDNDIVRIRYSDGQRSKKFFEQGRVGKRIKIIGKKIIGFTLKKGKTYTIYAIDKKENEVTKVIRVK